MLTKGRLRLLGRYFASECTDEERRSVESWISASEKNRMACDDLRKIWELSGKGSEVWESKRSMTAFRLRLKDAEATRPNISKTKFRLYRIDPRQEHSRSLSLSLIAQLAAVLILLAGIFHVVNYVKKMAMNARHPATKSEVTFQEVSTRPGQRATLRFNDGTQVQLNSASRLKYADYPDGSRQFYLHGEAYFEVVHSLYRPFIVHTSNAIIKDIGTKFDVSAWPGDDRTQVTVTQGRVVVHPKQQSRNDSAMVTPGQSTAVLSRGIVLRPRYIDVYRIISWTEGKLIFYNTPMADVVRQLGRRYGLICLMADSSILTKTLTATFDDKESTKEVLDIIALSLKLKYRTSKDSVLFVPSKSNSM